MASLRTLAVAFTIALPGVTLTVSAARARLLRAVAGDALAAAL